MSATGRNLPGAERHADSMITLTIPGAPRTKKNSGRIVHAGGLRLLPSKAWEQWANQVSPMLRAWALRSRLQPITYPVNCAALFYRDALRGNLRSFQPG